MAKPKVHEERQLKKLTKRTDNTADPPSAGRCFFVNNTNTSTIKNRGSFYGSHGLFRDFKEFYENANTIGIITSTFKGFWSFIAGVNLVCLTASNAASLQPAPIPLIIFALVT